MGQKIRQASAVTSFSPTAVSLVYDSRNLAYTWNANNKTLVEVDAGTTNTLLEYCDNLVFALYRRNPVTNSFNQFPVLSATNEAKVVQVNWRCGRNLVGKADGSAEMVSAKFVIRSR